MKKFVSFCLTFSLLVLPGCSWFSSTPEGFSSEFEWNEELAEAYASQDSSAALAAAGPFYKGAFFGLTEFSQEYNLVRHEKVMTIVDFMAETIIVLDELEEKTDQLRSEAANYMDAIVTVEPSIGELYMKYFADNSVAATQNIKMLEDTRMFFLLANDSDLHLSPEWGLLNYSAYTNMFLTVEGYNQEISQSYDQLRRLYLVLDLDENSTFQQINAQLDSNLEDLSEDIGKLLVRLNQHTATLFLHERILNTADIYYAQSSVQYLDEEIAELQQELVNKSQINGKTQLSFINFLEQRIKNIEAKKDVMNLTLSKIGDDQLVTLAEASEIAGVDVHLIPQAYAASWTNPIDYLNHKVNKFLEPVTKPIDKFFKPITKPLDDYVFNPIHKNIVEPVLNKTKDFETATKNFVWSQVNKGVEGLKNEGLKTVDQVKQFYAGAKDLYQGGVKGAVKDGVQMVLYQLEDFSASTDAPFTAMKSLWNGNGWSGMMNDVQANYTKVEQRMMDESLGTGYFDNFHQGYKESLLTSEGRQKFWDENKTLIVGTGDKIKTVYNFADEQLGIEKFFTNAKNTITTPFLLFSSEGRQKLYTDIVNTPQDIKDGFFKFKDEISNDITKTVDFLNNSGASLKNMLVGPVSAEDLQNELNRQDANDIANWDDSGLLGMTTSEYAEENGIDVVENGDGERIGYSVEDSSGGLLGMGETVVEDGGGGTRTGFEDSPGGLLGMGETVVEDGGGGTRTGFEDSPGGLLGMGETVVENGGGGTRTGFEDTTVEDGGVFGMGFDEGARTGFDEFLDEDKDGEGDETDNCPGTYNPAQVDTDSNGLGDLCDPDCSGDDDGDTVCEEKDNCPDDQNEDQLDTDKDKQGDVCDEDDDNDGVTDNNDNCPLRANPDQKDSNANGKGDLCDKMAARSWSGTFSGVHSGSINLHFSPTGGPLSGSLSMEYGSGSISGSVSENGGISASVSGSLRYQDWDGEWKNCSLSGRVSGTAGFGGASGSYTSRCADNSDAGNWNAY